MAPSVIVESAKAGTYIAPIAAGLALIFFSILACYALSAAKLILKLPFLKFGIYTVSTVCLIRGLLAIQLMIRKPDQVSDSFIYYGFGWFFVGLLYLIGYRMMPKEP